MGTEEPKCGRQLLLQAILWRTFKDKNLRHSAGVVTYSWYANSSHLSKSFSERSSTHNKVIPSSCKNLLEIAPKYTKSDRSYVDKCYRKLESEFHFDTSYEHRIIQRSIWVHKVEIMTTVWCHQFVETENPKIFS